MNAPVRAIVLLSIALSSAAAIADEDKDLDLIPKAAQQPASSSTPPPTASDRTQRIYLEDALTVSSPRGDLIVPFPPPAPPRWQERLLLDMRKQWSFGNRFSLTYSGRLNFRVEDGLGFPNHENVINDFREGYASWEPLDRTYLDAGRINLKSGVA